MSQKVESHRPIIEENSVVHLGGRDFDPMESKTIRSSQLKLYSPSEFHKDSEKASEEIAEFLTKQSDWIICHFDVDAIDPSIIPAVNYPAIGGLAPDDLYSVVRALSETGKLRVFNLAGYNSALDKKGRCGKAILDLVSTLPL